MLSGAAIREFQRGAAKRAAKEKRVPFIVEAEDIVDWKAQYEHGHLPRLPFPNIGSYRPEGWKLEEQIFCDSIEGFGSDSEPALSLRQLLNCLKVGKAYAIIEEGQFQLYLGEFDPPKGK